MNGPVIHFPTAEEEQQAMDEFFAHEKNYWDECRAAVVLARPALDRLACVLCGRSGQPYKLRSILFALYNGKPTRLEVVCLDWAIRKDLMAVCLAFGADDFFYQELKIAVVAAGQWDWFLEEEKQS